MIKLTRKHFILLSFSAFLTLTFGAWTQSVQSQNQGIIKVDGSSTVYPITEAVAEEFQKSKNGSIKVTVGISGTGGGFKRFCAGETDISNASRPIKAKEMEACKAAGIEYIELPVAYDALTVVVNPKNDWASNMTVTELKTLWEPAAQGKVTKWSQIRQGWPDEPIKLFGPGADSGTFEYFTEAIVGESKASRGDYTPSEDDNVLVQGVARDKNALGYFGFAYYEANKSRLKSVAVEGILPSKEAVENGQYVPLSRPIFIYVNAKAVDRSEVKEFVDFYLANSPKFVTEVAYVPLPAEAYEQAKANFQARKRGTVFGGEAAIGLSIKDLLQREARQ